MFGANWINRVSGSRTEASPDKVALDNTGLDAVSDLCGSLFIIPLGTKLTTVW